MIRLLTPFLFVLLLSNWSISQENSIDSTQISKVVRLINDYKSCKEYTDSLEYRLKECDNIVDRMRLERHTYAEIIQDYKELNADLNRTNTRLKKRIKRTRLIAVLSGVGGAILSFFIISLVN